MRFVKLLYLGKYDSVMSFKLLAIRPLKGCDKERFLKVLKPNEFYTFYNDYRFQPTSDENEIKIEYNATLPFGLFDDHVKNSINISAIVGKNGSGKSSLVELLYAVMYKLSVKKGIIEPEIYKIESSFNVNNLKNLINKYDLNIHTRKTLNNLTHDIDILQAYKTYLESKLLPTELEVLEDLKNINVQIFFTIDTGVIYVINSNHNQIKIHEIIRNNDNSNYFLKIDSQTIDCFDKLKKDKNLFYNIVNNYSLYGLNSNEIGDWIRKLFHKNDGYQAPIAINPMRTEGKININIENDLSKSRLLSNVLTPIKDKTKIANSFRSLVKNKVANKLILKIKTKYDDKIKEDNFKYFYEYGHYYLGKILNAFKSHKYEKDINEKDINRILQNPNLIEKITVDYIISKIERIAKQYKIGRDDYREKFKIDEKYVVNDFIERLKDEETHITFKLRQAINFLKYQYNSFNTNDLNQEIPIDSLSKEINANLVLLLKNYDDELKKIYEEDKKQKIAEGKDYLEKLVYTLPPTLTLINFIPPSIFDIDIEFEIGGKFNSLSSGEKQKIYGINTILYHINNINSIHGNQIAYQYNHINIILDEIELYFHPEMQRTFIKDLLDSLERLQTTKTKNISVNIIFITHSPFILSDIPTQNIMFLEVNQANKVAIQIKDREQTFGANIHDLLADSFFMEEEGYMGEFAKNEINKIIVWLEDKENKNEAIDYKLKIDMIGERLIKYKLEEMYFDKLGDEYIEIRELEKLGELAKKYNYKVEKLE